MNTTQINFLYWQNVHIWRLIEVKGALSGLRQFLATERLLKMTKNAFYFTSKEKFVVRSSAHIDYIDFNKQLVYKQLALKWQISK